MYYLSINLLQLCPFCLAGEDGADLDNGLATVGQHPGQFNTIHHGATYRCKQTFTPTPLDNL